MKLHPFSEVALSAATAMAKGATVYQQFNCEHCGVKQTMETPDKFFKTGKCEECGKITDIKKNGCNFLCAF